ncbi:MAG: GNAT family N-acetyltransferase [Phycisphaerae bacterium]
MANAEITPVGMNDLPLIVDLYNEIFRPGREYAFFSHRLGTQRNPLLLLAQVQKRPVGFALGYELKQSTFYCWYIGVLPEFRRAGVASQMMEAMTAWARDQGYQIIRFECYNRHRPMLHVAIRQNYNIVGIRYDADAEDNLIILEQNVNEEAAD